MRTSSNQYLQLLKPIREKGSAFLPGGGGGSKNGDVGHNIGVFKIISGMLKKQEKRVK